MESKQQPAYDVAGYEVLEETPGLRMIVVILDTSQKVP